MPLDPTIKSRRAELASKQKQINAELEQCVTNEATGLAAWEREMGDKEKAEAAKMPANIQKLLAVASGKRSASAPDVPTIAETGLDVVVESWYGVLVPAKTPAPIVARLNAAMVKVLAMPDVKEKLFAQGAEAVSNTPAEFEAIIHDELGRWEYVIREAKITPE